MHDLLQSLATLDPGSLHQRAVAAHRSHSAASWELAACLRAMERSGGYRALDCASVMEYAERKLALGHRAAVRLLSAARVLERYPLLSEACREGRLCWSKLREIAACVNADTEKAWLDFALAHSARDVERAVALSPRRFREAMAGTGGGSGGRHPATVPATEAPARGGGPPGEVQATLEGAGAAPPDFPMSPVATPAGSPILPGGSSALPGGFPVLPAGSPSARSDLTGTPVACSASPPGWTAVSAPLAPTAPALATPEPAPAPAADGLEPLPATDSWPSVPAPAPAAPLPPPFVKLELRLTADQLAMWDTAVNRLRSRKGKRISREAALEAMVRHFLATGDTRTRINHPVVVRVDPASGASYYETSQGVLPASPEAVEDALARETRTFVAFPGDEPIAAEAEADEPRSAEVRKQRSAEARDARAHEQPVAEARDSRAHEQRIAAARDARANEQPIAEGEKQSAPPTESLAVSAAEISLPPRAADTGRRSAIPLDLRRAALARAGYRCRRCGAASELEVDHVAPVCDGGSHVGNLQVLCRDCHDLKHAEAFAEDARYVLARETAIAQRESRRQAERGP